ncbi:MAG: hypothetical protein ACE5F5_04685 [Acidimicrobiia bacterium]
MKNIDLTLGKRWSAKSVDPCPHDETISVRSAGMERVLCNSCGHVSFRYVGQLTRTPDREFTTRSSRRIN